MRKKTFKFIFIGIFCLLLGFLIPSTSRARLINGECLERGQSCGIAGILCCPEYNCLVDPAGVKRCCYGDHSVDLDQLCYCNQECKSGACYRNKCIAVDTCSPAGCGCVPDAGDCYGVLNAGLTCLDPSSPVCCCPIVIPPPPSGPPCPAECICVGWDIGVDCPADKPEYISSYDCGGTVIANLCCCPTDTPPPPGSICQGYSDASRNCACADTGVCRGDNGDNIGMIDCSDTLICCCIPVGEVQPPDCGNGVVDPGEECEIDSDCSGGMTCVNCSCIEEGFVIGGNGGIINLQSPLGCTTIEECISRMINFLFSLAVILTPLMIILAGFLYITAAGRPEKIVQAQKLITWTLIGFLIVSLARAIIYVITSVIGG